MLFDENPDTPTPLSSVEMEAGVLEALRKSGAPPQIAYAFKKTGLLPSESNKDNIPSDRRREWDAAIDEYFMIEDAKAGKPSSWDTEIPELLVAGLNQEDFDHVHECIKAVAVVEGKRPMSLAARIELAAIFMLAAIDHAYQGAHAIGHPENAKSYTTGCWGSWCGVLKRSMRVPSSRLVGHHTPGPTVSLRLGTRMAGRTSLLYAYLQDVERSCPARVHSIV